MLDPSLPPERQTDELLDWAIDVGASDLHLDPGPEGGLVRARIDGVLQVVGSCAPPAFERLVGRIKVLGRLVIYQYDRLQEGRLSRDAQGKKVDVRVSIVPTPHGERVALRLFSTDGAVPRLSELGLPPRLVAGLRDTCKKRSGLVAVVGPMSSGKTTTLHALVAEIAREERRFQLVASIEDPVERRLPGVVQVEVAPERDITFASALAALLRQDATTLIVGEIRDGETAARAVDAALTGHLVLTTFHVGSPLDVVDRLMGLGVDPRLVSSALSGVLSQRLVRLLCLDCALPAPDGDAASFPVPGLRTVLVPPAGPRAHGPGCALCRSTGYRGRSAIGEWVPLDGPLLRLAARRPDEDTWEKELLARGIASLADAVAPLFASGATDADEVLRGLSR